MKRFQRGEDLNSSVIDAAAEWLIEFATGEPDLETRSSFDAWLRRSPEHVRAYIELLPLWDDATRIEAQGDYSTDRLIDLARSDNDNVASLPMCSTAPLADSATASGTRGGRSRRTLIALAAVIVGAVAVGAWLLEQRNLYATGIGEQRVIALDDGSSVELNAHSKLRVSYSSQLRRIDLLQGQALFRVAKDTQRPFVVASGQTQVRALGTQFDVYRRAGGTRVTVLEGRVLVSSAAETQSPRRAAPPDLTTAPEHDELVLAAGDQALATPESLHLAPNPNLQAATAWREHRLVFSSADLSDVADEFNRYNERQIVIRNDAHLPFEVSGAFSVTDIASLLAFLHSQRNVMIDENKERVVVTIEASPQ